jgi:hypothetical protein
LDRNHPQSLRLRVPSAGRSLFLSGSVLPILIIFLLLPHLAGCKSTPPVAPEKRTEIRKAVAAAGRPTLVLKKVGPAGFVFSPGGDNRQSILYTDNKGEKRTFKVFDRYFQLVFTVLSELRELGFKAHASRSLWDARPAALRAFYTKKDDRTVLYHLNMLKAFKIRRDILFRGRKEKIDFLARHKTMLDALPSIPLRPGEEGIREKEVMNRFFSPPSSPALELKVEVEEIRFEARDDESPGYRTARVALSAIITELHRKEILCDRYLAREIRLDGSGVKARKGIKGHTLQFREGEDPVTLAIRLIVRELALQIVPHLRKANKTP